MSSGETEARPSGHIAGAGLAPAPCPFPSIAPIAGVDLAAVWAGFYRHERSDAALLRFAESSACAGVFKRPALYWRRACRFGARPVWPRPPARACARRSSMPVAPIPSPVRRGAAAVVRTARSRPLDQRLLASPRQRPGARYRIDDPGDRRLGEVQSALAGLLLDLAHRLVRDMHRAKSSCVRWYGRRPRAMRRARGWLPARGSLRHERGISGAAAAIGRAIQPARRGTTGSRPGIAPGRRQANLVRQRPARHAAMARSARYFGLRRQPAAMRGCARRISTARAMG
jgi:hypothetical protein